ncbi:hypothetical protein KM043_010335 [Ampulex compressa]|nr:hypothetical protein KM043_010335 [Ampulex compressa]
MVGAHCPRSMGFIPVANPNHDHKLLFEVFATLPTDVPTKPTPRISLTRLAQNEDTSAGAYQRPPSRVHKGRNQKDRPFEQKAGGYLNKARQCSPRPSPLASPIFSIVVTSDFLRSATYLSSGHKYRGEVDSIVPAVPPRSAASKSRKMRTTHVGRRLCRTSRRGIDLAESAERKGEERPPRTQAMKPLTRPGPVAAVGRVLRKSPNFGPGREGKRFLPSTRGLDHPRTE